MVFLGFPIPPVSSTIFPHVFGATAPARLPPGLGAGGGGASPSEGRRDGGTSQTEGVGTTQWAMAMVTMVTMVVMGW